MPKLAVPEKSFSPKELDIRTRTIRAWLDTLPPTRPVDAANALLERVHRVNRTALPPDERLEFLQTIRPFADTVLEELAHLCSRATIPLADRARDALNAARSLAAELSVACRVAAVENAGRMLAFGAKRRVPALLIQAVDRLSSVAVASYRTYTPVPPGTWQSLHEIYLHAEESGYVAQGIEEESGRSVQDAYCEALLLALADPYRLRPGETDAAIPLARAAVAAATLTREAPRTSSGAHFVVACDSDRAPRAPTGAQAAGACTRVLDANGVIDRLRARRDVSRSTASGPGGKRGVGEEAALVEKLVALWGDPPRRGFRRDASNASVAICVGLATVRHFVAKESQHEQEQADAVRRGITMPLLAVPDDEAPGTHPVLEWDVVDEGAGGLKVRRERARQAVCVGELLGIRMLGRPRWIVGVVRWMSTDEAGAIEFGVEFMSPGARAVWLQPTITAVPQARPGLLLQRPGDRDAALLSPPDTFTEMREFEVRHEGNGSHFVRAVNLIERTAKFEVFEFSVG